MDTKITSTLFLFVCLLAAPLMAGNKAVATKAKAKTFVAANPARMNAEDRLQWLKKQSKKLLISNRVAGPYGLAQNPGQEVRRTVVKKKKTNEFLNAIAAIEINAVISSDSKFIVGSREFRKGDVFPLVRGTREFRTQIIAVKTDNILFKDMDTGEMIKKNLTSLPRGMTRNSHIAAVPGVTPAGKKNDASLTVE